MLDASVVIMAGGRGARLEPFTKILPKALVPVHDKPIIEHIIERFTKVGCMDFHLTVNYKSRILKAYFEDLEADYHMQFVEEQEPLGTAGSLRFLDKKFNKPFIVTNCDIIIKVDYSKLYKFHQNYYCKWMPPVAPKHAALWRREEFSRWMRAFWPNS